MANTSTYKGIYAMHKYWGKKPFNEISKFIEKYTVSGETVLDSFCGSGVTLIEALKLHRKCIGVDLNPIAIKLAKASVTPVETSIIKNEFNKIKANLQDKINSLYEVFEDEISTIVSHTIWKNEEPIEVWYESEKKKKTIRQGRQIDIDMAFEPKIMSKWYPNTQMVENSRINVGKDQTIADLFTPRALVALSLLWDEIKRIPDVDIRRVFELTFSGTLSQASNLVFVIRGRNGNDPETSRAEVGSWVIGYWVPEEHFEINVWRCFENRYKRILKGEEEIFDLFSKYDQSELDEVSLITGSATELPFPKNSVDYVFIDPPHSNRILYMEQSLMWNAWLQIDENLNWEDEVIVTEAKDRQNKNANNYNELLNKSFAEIKRVLKPDRYFSMAFNCLDDNTWLDTLNLFSKNGFEIVDIIPLEYSATSVIQDNRKNALKTDFVLTFKNVGNSNLIQIKFRDDDITLERDVLKMIKEYPNYEVYNIMNALFEKTIPEGYIYKVSSIVKVCADILQ